MENPHSQQKLKNDFVFFLHQFEITEPNDFNLNRMVFVSNSSIKYLRDKIIAEYCGHDLIELEITNSRILYYAAAFDAKNLKNFW